MEKLLNRENIWENGTTCKKVGGPCELIGRYNNHLDSIKNDKEG